MLVAMGRCNATCFGLSAAIDCQVWSGIGELICTASTFGSLSKALKSVNRFLLKRVPNGVQLLFRALEIAYIFAWDGADKWDEFRAKSEAHNGHVDLFEDS